MFMFFAVDRNPSAVSQNATTFLSLQDGTVQEGNPFQVRCLEPGPDAQQPARTQVKLA